MKMSVSVELEAKLKKSLSEQDINGAFEVLHDNKYETCWKTNCWEIVPIVVEQLTEDHHREHPEWYDSCEKLLELVIDNATPEEALLEFIEQVELAKNHKAFISVLTVLRRILLKITVKRERSLEWCFTSIKRYVVKINCPINHNLEGEEHMLLDSDENTQNILTVYSSLIYFVQTFIQEDNEKKHKSDLCTCFLFQLLQKPFATLNLENNVKVKSHARRIAEEIMALITKVTSNKMQFLEYLNKPKVKEIVDSLQDTPEEKFVTSVEEIPVLCLGIFYYLLLAENIEIESNVLVYSDTYVTENGMYAAVYLMQHEDLSIVSKGTLLAYRLVELIPDDCTHMLLDSSIHCVFIQSLLNIMVYCTSKESRQLAKQIFDKYFLKFNNKGRFLLILNINIFTNHMGVKGLLVSKYKDSLVACLKNDEKNLPIYFRGPYLKCILKTFVSLPDGVTTDLMHSSELLLAVLNFLRFLFLRDAQNLTGVWDCAEMVREVCLTPLHKAIEISKEHYRAAIEDLTEKQVGKGDGNSVDRLLTVKVGHENIANGSTSEKINVLRSTMNCLDLMDSLLARVEECLEKSSNA